MQWNIGYPINRAAPLNRGLVAWFLRPPVLVSNARWLDLCNTYHGTLVAGPAWSGKRLRSRSWGSLGFDGVDDYVNLPSTLSLTSWTVAAWVSTTSAAEQDIANLQSDSITLRINSGTQRPIVWVRVVDSWYSAESATGLTANVAAHLAATYDGEILSLFMDGVSVATNGTPVGDTHDGSVNHIGMHFNGISSPVSGALDDIRIYSRAISDDEISRLYQVSKTGYVQEMNWIRDSYYGNPLPPEPPLILSKQFYQAVNRASRY